MRVEAKSLLKPMTLTIVGNEGWLEDIYQSYPHPSSSSKPFITGQIRFAPGQTPDSIEVSGSLNYEPFVNCSRCNEPITWPITQTFSICYRQPPPTGGENKLPREMSLSRDDLEAYYLENGGVCVFGLINDIVNLAIPLRTVPPENAQHHCSVCLAPDSSRSSLVFASDEAAPSPFSILRAFKSDDN